MALSGPTLGDGGSSPCGFPSEGLRPTLSASWVAVAAIALSLLPPPPPAMLEPAGFGPLVTRTFPLTPTQPPPPLHSVRPSGPAVVLQPRPPRSGSALFGRLLRPSRHLRPLSAQTQSPPRQSRPLSAYAPPSPVLAPPPLIRQSRPLAAYAPPSPALTPPLPS
ncbi:hypothetical protein chiPu_0029247 [Chiloscyllium punctatum]|uniref:Uncharacterized protein n=1 Tax=Chiloscyllium punctatum TaxID=137246 RepID=A0A401TRW9_CHIPU|nr:hypothetical protein [Chiloscyllium punctatum]